MALSGLLALGTAALAAEKPPKLHVYNWSDYIAEDTIAQFEQTTGIQVVYDVYDSNEILEAKLLAGHSGYDLVFPTAQPFAKRHLEAQLYLPLERAKLSNYGNLDQDILRGLESADPGNRYLVPYMWGSTGIGYNVEQVEQHLGADAPLDSWRLLFDPALAQKLAPCGISLLDDEVEGVSAALMYLGKDPNSTDSADIAAAEAALRAIRPHIRYFHSSQYINDLANGDTCVALGYSGDVLQARNRAEEAGNGVQIAFAIPKEGALLSTDVMAIPADAPHPKQAHQLIDFLLRPEVAAAISNYVAFANANRAATPLLDEAIRKDPGIYPPPEVMAKLNSAQVLPATAQRLRVRAWTRVKSGR
jgi:putrescine transport system substrate-binding protein